ncbi:hypothetical protein V6N12_025878 [Hibiscus sabdariffa]|uniref:Uncharacterized protein n=1 Tax=Hibiscus sabdariffa TaxID=183260 RepID=A0ABR2DQ44_9ROSI
MDKAAGDDGSGRLMVIGVCTNKLNLAGLGCLCSLLKLNLLIVRGTILGGAGGRVAETDLEVAELWRLGNAI